MRKPTDRRRHAVPRCSSARIARTSDRYACNMSQGGIGMPDRDYYLSADPKLADTRAKYLEHLTNMLTLAGEPNAAARAKAILDFETKIAQGALDQGREPRRQQDLQQDDSGRARASSRRASTLPTLVKGDGANVDYVIVCPAERVQRHRGAVGRTPLSVLKDQLLVRSIDAYAEYLPKEFDEENFAFYGTVLSGTPEQEARWKRAVELHRRQPGRRRQQALRRQIFPAGDQGRGRPAGQQHHRGDGPADRQARVDERRRPRPRRTPSSPPSRRRSAIRRNGAT